MVAKKTLIRSATRPLTVAFNPIPPVLAGPLDARPTTTDHLALLAGKEPTLLETPGRGHARRGLVAHDAEEAAFSSDPVLALTSRPGAIAADVPVELGRARPPGLELESAFSAERRVVMGAFLTAQWSAGS
jgi:ABC-type taurine transport system ATPase subunit